MDPLVTVSAPATVANLGPGYDVIGLALDHPRDVLRLRLVKGAEDSLIVSGVSGKTISTTPGRNSCIVAARAVLKLAGKGGFGFEAELTKGVPPRMGMGSSGASSAAGAYAANHLLGNPLGSDAVLACAMEGERAACGSAHADNVAPALHGGITVITCTDPPTVVRLEPPENVCMVIVSPKMDVGDEKTKRAREVLPESVPLAEVVHQVCSFSSLLLGIVKGDPVLMGRGASGDVIVEPARAKLIPGFSHLKKAALDTGAYGFSISGAGPSVFALAPPMKGEVIAKAVAKAFSEVGLDSVYGCYGIGKEGVMVVR